MAEPGYQFEQLQGWPGWEMARPWQRGANTLGGAAYCTVVRRKGGVLTLDFEASSPGTLIAAVLAGVRRADPKGMEPPNLLAIVKSQRLMLYAYKAVREREGWGPHPELEQCIADCEAAIAMVEDPRP